MSKQDSLFLGVDVGGTHLKIGLVDREGTLLDFQKEDTTPYRDHPDGFGKCFIEGMGNLNGRFVIILDINRVFTAEDLVLAQGMRDEGGEVKG